MRVASSWSRPSLGAHRPDPVHHERRHGLVAITISLSHCWGKRAERPSNVGQRHKLNGGDLKPELCVRHDGGAALAPSLNQMRHAEGASGRRDEEHNAQV